MQDIEKEFGDISATESFESSNSGKRKFFSKKNIILLIIFVLIILVWKFKGNFIAATVNGNPISRFQLDDQLRKRFGSQVLDNLINERLILGATRQKGIFVTDAEIKERIKQIEDRLQGKTTLTDALKVQGLTEEDLRRQIEIQIAIDKLFETESTVSAKEIDDYILKNKEFTQNATDPAALKAEVNDILKQQKTADSFDKWFADIRKDAKISKYL